MECATGKSAKNVRTTTSLHAPSAFFIFSVWKYAASLHSELAQPEMSPWVCDAEVLLLVGYLELLLLIVVLVFSENSMKAPKKVTFVVWRSLMQQAVVPSVKTKPQLRPHYTMNSLLRCSQLLVVGSKGSRSPSLLFSTTSTQSYCKKTTDTIDTKTSDTLGTHNNLSKLYPVYPSHVEPVMCTIPICSFSNGWC